jgi:pyruvate ferredoxin oxidoreductase delta subunit
MSSKLSMDKLSIGCVALPGGSLVYKTGAWRTNRPVFKHVACNGCRSCELVCPEGCVFENPEKKHTIEQGGKKREVADRDFDPDYCKGCGMCAAECPVDDIDMVPEVK